MKEKIYTARGFNKKGREVIQISGKGEAFKKGMETLAKDSIALHWFKCKKCEHEFQADSHLSKDKCPNCKINIGNNCGCFSGIPICELIHGKWENIEGICKCYQELTMVSFEKKRTEYPSKKREQFDKHFSNIPNKSHCLHCGKQTIRDYGFLKSYFDGNIYLVSECSECKFRLDFAELNKILGKTNERKD